MGTLEDVIYARWPLGHTRNRSHGAANRQIPFVAAPVQGAHGMESSPMNRATKRQWVYAASSHALIDRCALANEISSIILRPNDMLNYNLFLPSFD